MFISGTLYILFSFIFLIANQIYKDLYYNEKTMEGFLCQRKNY